MNFSHYVFDLDDTLVGTKRYNNQRIFTSGNQKAIDQLRSAAANNTPTQLLPPPANVAAWNLLKDGRFMLEARPTISVEQNLTDLKNWFAFKRADGIRFSICTHRGWHVKGKDYSARWLDRLNLLQYFDDIHSIKTEEFPNKPDFLNSVYGGDWLLFDDNPVHETADNHITLGLEKHLMVCHTEHVFPYTKNLPSFNCIGEIIRSL